MRISPKIKKVSHEFSHRQSTKEKGIRAATSNPLFSLTFHGAEGQNRTADTGIFSPLLYRLSYLGSRNPIDFYA